MAQRGVFPGNQSGHLQESTRYALRSIIKTAQEVFPMELEGKQSITLSLRVKQSMSFSLIKQIVTECLKTLISNSSICDQKYSANRVFLFHKCDNLPWPPPSRTRPHAAHPGSSPFSTCLKARLTPIQSNLTPFLTITFHPYKQQYHVPPTCNQPWYWWRRRRHPPQHDHRKAPNGHAQTRSKSAQ